MGYNGNIFHFHLIDVQLCDFTTLKTIKTHRELGRNDNKDQNSQVSGMGMGMSSQKWEWEKIGISKVILSYTAGFIFVLH